MTWALGLSVPFVFYFVTCCRTIGLTDSAVLINLMVHCRLSSHVNAHNLTALVGHLFTYLPLDKLAYRCNLMSVVVGGAAVAVYFIVLRGVTRDGWLALLLSSLLMVSHSMWWHSTIAESYAFNALLTIFALWLLLRYERTGLEWYFYLLCGVAGLAFFNHISMGVIGVAAFVALVASALRSPQGLKRRIPLAALAFAVGFLPYGLVLARDLIHTSDPTETLRLAVGGNFTSIMFEADPSPVRSFLEWVVLQFPSPFVLFVPFGMVSAVVSGRTRCTALAMMAAAAVNTGFFMHYVTWDQFAFYLPTFVILAWFGAMGVATLVSRLRSVTARGLLYIVLAFSILVPPWLYRVLPSLPQTSELAIGFRFDNSYTQNSYDYAGFIANPNKRHFDGVARFADLVLANLPESALFIDDDSRTFGPLRYYQRLLMRRPDVRIEGINSWGFEDWGLDAGEFLRAVTTHPARVFVVSNTYPYEALLAPLRPLGCSVERFDLDPDRWIYEIVSPTERQSGTLSVTGLRTGLNLDEANPIYKNVFGRKEEVVVEVLFEETRARVPFYTEWRSPDGGVAYTNDAFVIPAGATAILAELMLQPRERPYGRWEVTAVSRGRRLRTVSFEIR